MDTVLSSQEFAIPQRNNETAKKEVRCGCTRSSSGSLEMPPIPTPEMIDDSSSNQMPQPSLLPDDKLGTSAAADLEKGLGGTTHTTRGGMCLRWARITKEVEIKEGSG